LMGVLPIATPTDTIRAEIEEVVTRLIDITRASQEIRQLVLDWLFTEFNVQEPGKRLDNFVELDRQAFVAEVRKRRPKAAGKLTPATLKALQAGYAEQIIPIQQYKTEAATLEHKLNDLVNAAYGLTAEEVTLLWATAPPRMPLVL
ncbi:MAG: class I SAM-dependent DNA methyltransferase, partial [Ktedonobacteraceae bacterium]